MKTVANRISICIPHWQVGDFMAVCLRSIRHYSRHYDIEMIVVDNGSKDESLDWLRSLSWIRLFERPEFRIAVWVHPGDHRGSAGPLGAQCQHKL